MNKNIVIWGDDHHNALGLLRMLGNRNLNLFLLIGKKVNIATASKYCTNYIVIPDLEDGLNYLLNNYHDEKNKAVLLFTADRYSEFANEHLNILEKYFYVCGVAIEGQLKEIDDKFVMGELAKSCGFNVPNTKLIFSNDSNNTSKFPLIIKPSRPISKDFKTIVIKNQKELNSALKNLLPGKRYVVQDYIQKKADCLVYGCRTLQGKTLIAGACIRNRWSDDGCGSFGYITPKLPTGVNAKNITTFLNKINFIGLFSVEYGLIDGDAYFYEFNLRNDGTSILFYQAGSNLALSFVNSCFGIDEEINNITEKKFLINEFWDKFNVKDRKISKKTYLEDFNKATLFFYYDPNDLRPYEIQKSLSVKRYIKRIVSKSLLNKIRLRIKNNKWRKKYIQDESDNKC